MRSNDTRIPSGGEIAAPESPVPLPRAVTGRWSSSATLSTAATSSVDRGRTTARGTLGVAVRASSWA